MKRPILFLTLLMLPFAGSAQTLFSTDSLAAEETLDSLLTLPQDTLPVSFTPSDLDSLLLAHTLRWLDTTGCTGQPDTALLPDSVYISRLQLMPCVIEMPYNTAVRRFIDLYVRRNPARLSRLRMLSGYYFPLFTDALHRYSLPEELKHLPVIESGLNPTAYSRVGAAGLWQFMPATGKLCGLEVNSLVDERLDPIKATDAACRFLKELYAVYHDWNLVIAAYNCGPGNVNKAIRRAGGKRDFWDIYPYLPRETRSYLPIFIAANYALTYADEHNICAALPDRVLATDTIVTEQRMHLLQVSEVTGIPLTELRRLNPQYRWDILPGGKPYALCLPIEQTGAFIELQDSILRYKSDSLINNRREKIDLAQKTAADGYPASGMYWYTVKKGDVLGTIAKRQRTTVGKIKKWNNMKNDNIRIGQKLKMYR